MSHYILIHGAWGGAWEFNKMQNALHAQGHSTQAIDLPGHGNNKVPLVEVTLKAYVDTVIDAVTKHKGKSILAGHSLGGAVISRVADIVPHKIETLVYICAILPQHGESVLEIMQKDEQGELLPGVIFSEDKSYCTLSDDTIKNVLLNDIIDEHRLPELIAELSIKQATEPFMAQIDLSGNYDRVPKVYIRASVDKVISPQMQELMIERVKVEHVFSIDSGHFPLLSKADELIKVMMKIGLLYPVK